MENPLEHLTEDRHFLIREKIQSQIIADFYDVSDVYAITNEQAYSWLKQNAASFDVVFKEIVNEHPSFWDDAEKDFPTAASIVKERFINETSFNKK